MLCNILALVLKQNKTNLKAIEKEILSKKLWVSAEVNKYQLLFLDLHWTKHVTQINWIKKISSSILCPLK